MFLKQLKRLNNLTLNFEVPEMISDHVFIVGFWNSGTSILARLLSRHPDIKIKVSGRDLNYEENVVEKSLQRIGLHLPHFELEKVIKYGLEPYTIASPKRTGEFAEHLNSCLGKRRRLLKNCRLFFCKELLDNAFPKAKRIIIHRDGRSQAISKGYWKNNPDAGLGKLRNRSKLWSMCVDYHFKYWYKDPQTITVRYENLCNDTKRTIAGICDFVCLDFTKIKNRIPPSLKNMNYRWSNLDESLKSVVEKEVIPSLNKLNELHPVCDNYGVSSNLQLTNQLWLIFYHYFERLRVQIKFYKR